MTLKYVEVLPEYYDELKEKFSIVSMFDKSERPDSTLYAVYVEDFDSGLESPFCMFIAYEPIREPVVIAEFEIKRTLRMQHYGTMVMTDILDAFPNCKFVTGLNKQLDNLIHYVVPKERIIARGNNR